MFHRLIFILVLLFTNLAFGTDAPDLEDRTRAIATELRCVVCQNLSVADSPSEMAQQMRAIVREQLQAGKTRQEIKDFFVSKYGEWVLLAPSTKGFALTVWVAPFVVLIGGLGLGLLVLRRWARKKSAPAPQGVDAALLARVRSEAKTTEAPLDLEDSRETAPLSQERARLYADLKELEFDYQAGKFSESDYTELRRDVELKAATVLEHLDQFAQSAPTARAADKRKRTPPAPQTGAASQGRLRRWQLATGAVFLLLFGVTIGVTLTKSLRPRESAEDSITGDFLTGTDSAKSANSEAAAALKEGKTAFSKQDFAKAIEAFKKVLAADPNQPEAHAYMGFILMQAGHADGALLAFEKALAVAPNFPMALWGKGMTLYQEKQDYAGATEALEKLLKLMAPGNDRNEVEKVLAEMRRPGQRPTPPTQAASQPADSGAHVNGTITGTITIDAKLKANIDSQAALFIIARPAGTATGPPLAVKKIDRPTFPLAYSLGSENVMMQERPFTGKVTITARLDKDGNPTTRTAGDLSGDYKKNPVEVGANNVDIVLDQVAQ